VTVGTAALPSLEQIVERAERLVALSPADATAVLWSEGRRGGAVESARVRRAEAGAPKSLRVRVRLHGRTGIARAEPGEVGELQAALRAALADARCQDPSPDWETAAASGGLAPLDGLHDPEVAALEPEGAQAMLRALAERRATLRLRWSERRLVVASSFHTTRAATLTSLTLEARTGRRPGSGFAAATSRTLAGLDPRGVLARAQALEARVVDHGGAAGALPLLIAPEAAATLADAFSRSVLSGRSRLERLAGTEAGPFPLAESVTLVDEPLLPVGAPLPFDLDGTPKRRRVFVERGRSRGAAFDLELAALAGDHTTGHGMGGDDAWPAHLEIVPGGAGEPELAGRAAGGLRIGSLEEFAVDPGRSLGFRAIARSVRRIEADGTLGAALPPLSWQGRLATLFAAVEEVGRDLVAWMPRDTDLGAMRAPALRLAPTGGLSPRRGDA